MNGNFEAGLDPWYMNRWDSAYMLELSDTDRGKSALNKDRMEYWNGVQQTLSLEDIQKGDYHLSCYGKIQNGTTSDYLQLTLRITTAEYGATYPGWSTRTLINANDWTLVEGTVSTDVPGTITEVTVYAEAETVSTNYWVDDVEVVLISAQPTSNPTPSTANPTPNPTTKSPTSFPTTPTPTTKSPTAFPTTSEVCFSMYLYILSSNIICSS